MLMIDTTILGIHGQLITKDDELRMKSAHDDYNPDTIEAAQVTDKQPMIRLLAGLRPL